MPVGGTALRTGPAYVLKFVLLLLSATPRMSAPPCLCCIKRWKHQATMQHPVATDLCVVSPVHSAAVVPNEHITCLPIVAVQTTGPNRVAVEQSDSAASGVRCQPRDFLTAIRR